MELLKIRDLLKKNTVLATFFREKGIDFANSGEDNLAEALDKKGYDRKNFIAEMEDFMNGDHEERHLTEELVNLPLTELLLHLQMTHHVRERELLFEIDRLLNKSLLLNYDKMATELISLHRLFATFKSEIEIHYLIEDKKIFPVLYSASTDGGSLEKGRRDLKILEEDHKGVGEIIDSMRKLTKDFKAPAEGDLTVARTYELIGELIDSVLIHMYLENYILIDALELEEKKLG